MSMQTLLNLLYIPIWLYSNGFPFRNIQPTLYFTFQSGYIQMVFVRKKLLTLYGFTFQSGYIQIVFCPLTIVHLITLHSNLVIFKLL